MNKMQRSMKPLMLAAGAVSLMAGCSTYHVERDTQLAPPMTNGGSNPYYVDYSIKNERVKGTGTASCWFWIFAFSDGRFAPVPTFDASRSVHAAKASATYDALENAKADALMGALYRYKVNDYFFYRKVECEATGFPANMKSVNMIHDKPVVLSKDDQVIRIKPWETLDGNGGGVFVKPSAQRRSWFRRFFFFELF